MNVHITLRDDDLLDNNEGSVGSEGGGGETLRLVVDGLKNGSIPILECDDICEPIEDVDVYERGFSNPKVG